MPKAISNDNFTILSHAEYIRDLCARIAKTTKGDRVALMTMSFDATEDLIARLMSELNTAAERGVTVRVAIDAHDFIYGDGLLPGPLFTRKQLPANMPKSYRQNFQALERLKASGGDYSIINVPQRRFRPPFVGRSHIKHAVINDRVYVGGCNLKGCTNIDLMVAWVDAKIANLLYDLTGQARDTGSVKSAMNREDLKVTVNPTTTLLIDAGVPKQSAIMQAALALIDQAEDHIFITCQFVPDDPIMSHLAAAHARGVKVELVYNHPSKFGLIRSLPSHGSRTIHQLRKVPAPVLRHPLPKTSAFLHAKIIATENGVLIGSHNYVNAGVTFGTAEIAILRRDSIFATESIEEVQKQIKLN